MNIPTAFGSDGPALADTGASDYRLEGPAAPEHDYVNVQYAGLRWSVVDTRVMPTTELLGRAEVEVDVLVENTLASTDIRFSERLVRLSTRDGIDLGTGRFVDEGVRLSIAPGETQEVTLQFRTGRERDPMATGLQLVIGEPGRIPARLPLAGTSFDEVTSVFAAVDETPTLLEDPDDPQRQILVTPDAALITIDAGPYRAAEGDQLALVKVIVERTASSETSGFLGTDFWSLDTDIEETKAIMVARTSQPASNADEVTLLFAFDDDASSFALTAGAGTSESASFTLVVPNG
ncbi:MAG: hypothetical protein AAGD35_15710 [Actinomycetota bacterium]